MNRQFAFSAVFTLLLLATSVGQYAYGERLTISEKSSLTAPSKHSPLTAAEYKLLGKHKFSLQWISWERFGVAIVKRGRNGLEIDAKQTLNGDWATLKGTVQVVDDKTFYVTGQVITQVHHINNGQPCERNGTFEFRATGKRKYWRMQEMQNPCDSATDYIDVYFH